MVSRGDEQPDPGSVPRTVSIGSLEEAHLDGPMARRRLVAEPGDRGGQTTFTISVSVVVYRNLAPSGASASHDAADSPIGS